MREVDVREVVVVELEVAVLLAVVVVDELVQVAPEHADVVVVVVDVAVPVLMVVVPPPSPKRRTIDTTEAVQRMPIVNATFTVRCPGIAIQLRPEGL